jgi:Tol biopolymer transport system component/DNA-binding winged helix-turn-helix (wHTH) protein
MSFRPKTNERSVNPAPRVFRFDAYEVDLESGELYRDGRRIHLQAQPMQLLTLLLQNSGALVTREEVRRELWPADTFVDFDRSLATAVNKIREALGDSAEAPKFIETLPKRGYRFIGKLEAEPPLEFRARPTDVAGASELSNSGKTDGVRIAPSSRSWNWTIVAAWFVVGVIVSSAAVLFWTTRDRSTEPTAWTVTQFTSFPGLQESPAFSPDGSRIAFAWNSNSQANAENGLGFDLYVKGLVGEATLRLTNHPSQWLSPTWSPDGTRIAFLRLAGPETGLYIVPALGGAEKKIRSTHTPYKEAAPISWSPDGNSIAYSDRLPDERGDRIFVVSLNSEESHVFYHDPACKHEGSLTFSHDGKKVAWICVKRLDAFDIMVGDSLGKSRRCVAEVSQKTVGIGWNASDTHLFIAVADAASSELHDLNIKTGGMTKWPEAGTSGFAHTFNAKTGAVAWAAHRDQVNLWRKDLTRQNSSLEPILSSTRNENMAISSPDGKHIVFDSDRSGTWSVWLADADGGNLTRISQGGSAGYPRWSPDSRHVAYFQIEGDVQSVYVVDIDERAPRKLLTRLENTAWPFWSADGEFIYFLDFSSFRQRYYRCSIDCNKNEVLVRDGAKSFNMQASPDGEHWYYVRGDEPPRVYRESMRNGKIDSGSEALQGFPVLADPFLWTVGKNGVYFVAANKPKAVSYFDFATGKISDLHTGDKVLADGMSVSSDEKSLFVAQQGERHSEIMLARPQK